MGGNSFADRGKDLTELVVGSESGYRTRNQGPQGAVYNSSAGRPDFALRYQGPGLNPLAEAQRFRKSNSRDGRLGGESPLVLFSECGKRWFPVTENGVYQDGPYARA